METDIAPITAIRQLAEDLVDLDHGDEFEAAQVLLAAMLVGPHRVRIRQITGLSLSRCDDCSYYLRMSGLWKGKRFPTLHYGEWSKAVLNDFEGADINHVRISFALEVGTALGNFDRTEKDGEYLYEIRSRERQGRLSNS